MSDKQTEALKLALEALEPMEDSRDDTAIQRAITAIRSALAEQPAQQPNEADELIRNLGFDPERFRTEAGFINHMKLRAAIQHPEEYPAHSSLKLKWCHVCGLPNPKEGVCNHGIEQPAQHQYTYASTQATMCAGCGEHKHTPLRIDAMGGYVCLTCIDQKLGSLLGEFGYPEPEQPAQQEPVAIADGTFNHNCPIGTPLYTSPQPAPVAKPHEQQEPVAAFGNVVDRTKAYDAIDRFLRNNLDDSDYSEYSAALEALYTSPQPAQQQEPVAWMPIEQMYPQAKAIDILMGDGSILCSVLPQFDGDLWWEGSGIGEKFIDPKYANVTHWRIHDERTSPPSQRTWIGVTDEEIEQVCVPLGAAMLSFTEVARAIEAKLREKNA